MQYKQFIEPDELSKALNKSGRDYVRELVRQRDGRTCQNCGKKWKPGMRRFDVHHLDGSCGMKSLGHDRIEDMPGLITYCHKCHLNLEEVRLKMKNKTGNVKNSPFASSKVV